MERARHAVHIGHLLVEPSAHLPEAGRLCGVMAPFGDKWTLLQATKAFRPKLEDATWRVLERGLRLRLVQIGYLENTAENFVCRLTTILFPLDSVVFYPDGNSQGNAMENSGK